VPAEELSSRVPRRRSHAQLGRQSAVRILSNRPTLGFQKYVFQPMVKRSATGQTLLPSVFIQLRSG
jgi:hypothetical protein